jgi:hypothetical protein
VEATAAPAGSAPSEALSPPGLTNPVAGPSGRGADAAAGGGRAGVHERGVMSDAAIVRQLAVYLLPKDNPEYRWRVATALTLLVGAKALNVAVRRFGAAAPAAPTPCPRCAGVAAPPMRPGHVRSFRSRLCAARKLTRSACGRARGSARALCRRILMMGITLNSNMKHPRRCPSCSSTPSTA